MFVKICGLTTPEDSLAAIDSGALALGFNLVPSSPRYVLADALSGWIHRLPAHVWKVGVFANEDPSVVASRAALLGLDIVQLHGKETPAAVPANLRVWKAVRITSAFEPSALDAFPVEALLLDGPASGVAFDWSLAARHNRKVILAGGLDASNVREAIAHVRPWGVDICSRIESAPGRKDHRLMRQFIETALSC